MPRRQRQRDELRELCRSGAIRRALDLAFQHFADFGPDDQIVELLDVAMVRSDPPDELRSRFRNLREALSARRQCDVSTPAQSANSSEEEEPEQPE